MLSILCGMGVQIGFMIYLTVFTLFTGLISPLYRTIVFVYGFSCLAIAGVFNGYFSTIMASYLGLYNWRGHTFFSAFSLPFWFLISFLVIDFIEYEEQSSSYIPFTSLAFYTFIWFVVSVPLSVYGSYRGYRDYKVKKSYLPRKVNAIKRAIPYKIANSNSVVIASVMLAGMFIFTHVAV